MNLLVDVIDGSEYISWQCSPAELQAEGGDAVKPKGEPKALFRTTALGQSGKRPQTLAATIYDLRDGRMTRLLNLHEFLNWRGIYSVDFEGLKERLP